MQTGTKLTVKSVSEVFPMVSEAWTSTIRSDKTSVLILADDVIGESWSGKLPEDVQQRPVGYGE